MLWILAAEGPNGKFIPGDVNEFWWGFGAFAVVLILGAWKLGPVIRRVMRKRTETVAEELSAAEATRVAAEAEVSALRERLASAEAERERILAEGSATAERVKADLIAAADAEVADLRARGEADLAAVGAHASSDLQAVAADQAVRAAEAVVRENLDDASQQALVEQYIQQLGAMR